MQAGGLELRPAHPQPVDEYPLHQGGFLFLGVVGDPLEVEIVVVAVDGPGAHGQAELDVGLDLPGVGGAVEKPELHGAFGKEGVKIDAVVAGGVVVAVADAALVTVVPGAVPDVLGSVPALPAGLFHCLEQLRADFVAPAVCPVADLKSLVEQVLPPNGKVQQAREAFRGVVGAIHMDMDAAGGVCHSPFLDQRTDNVLQVLDVLVLKDGGDDLAGIPLIGRDDFITTLLFTADAAVAHGLPGAALAVASAVGVVGGADVAGGLAEVFRDGSGCGGAGDAGQLNFDAEVLVLDAGTHIDFSLSLVGG